MGALPLSPPRGVPVSVRLLLVALVLLAGVPAIDGQEVVTFEIDDIDLGTIDRIGDLSWSHTLGTTWNQNFSIGGMVGKQNATIFPEVRDPFFGEVIIPEIKADTRTGARFAGNISGGTGLQFYADFQASGLSAGSDFDFRPTVHAAADIASGEFFRLDTSTGMVNNAAFNQHAIDLPSFEAGMDFFFDLALQSRVEAALFPFAPYVSTTFNPAPIHVDQSLLKFEFDLDPDSNPGSEAGIPPRLVIFEDTLFESSVEFLDDSASVASKQLSVDVEVKDQPGVTRRLDIGEVQLVNPFGVGESILGGSAPNLTITTTMDESGVRYAFDTPLLRLGLDLDGIAAFLGTGQSFTRIEEEIEGFATVTADLIDIKYGPEIGYRETVEIKPDFAVTLNFDQDVVVKSDTGVTITNTLTGLWSDLPEFAMLGLDPVEVSVVFDGLTGTQTKRSVFYLTDYLEFTLLELEDVTILDTLSFSLPPLVQARTSVLGALLGEIELTLDDQTQTIAPFALGDGLPGGTSFTLQPAPSKVVYAAGSFVSVRLPENWVQLADGASASTLSDKTLYIGIDNGGGSGDGPATVADLSPGYTDYGDSLDQGTATVTARGMVIAAGGTLAQYSGERVWDVNQVINDGHVLSYAFTQFGTGGGVLQVAGQGTMLFTTAEASFHTQVLVHGPGHTMTFDGTVPPVIPPVYDDSGPLHHVGTVVNGGELIYRNLRENTTADLVNTATGVLRVTGASGIIDWWGDVENTGMMIAEDGARMTIDDAGPNNLTAPGGSGVFAAYTGALIELPGETQIGTETSLSLSGPPVTDQLTFVAGGDATIRFGGTIEHRYDVNTRFETEVGGTMVLNGIRFAPLSGFNNFDEIARIASDFTEVVNRGTLIVQSGENMLFITPPGSQNPGAPPPVPQPVVTPLNLVNTGEVIVQAGASFGFEVEITDYAEGGATFDQGKWTLIGGTPISSFSNTTSIDDAPATAAVLDLRVVQVSNDDAYIGGVFFGDGNGIQDFDTHLAVNAADITLSGQALFPYLNTIEENRGSLTLLNRNRFTTVGSLRNTGDIRVEGGSSLRVTGELIVDEGTVFVDAASFLSAGSHTEVIGGTVTIDRGPELPEFINSSWIIREKWIGEDANGDDIILPATVSYGEAWVPFIGVDADILLQGEQATFESLTTVSNNYGKLTLAAGNELRLTQGFGNVGTLTLIGGAKLYVAGFLHNTGEFHVDANSYLDFDGPWNATTGSIALDGVAHGVSLSTSGASVLTGAGRFTGSLDLAGTLLAEVGPDDNTLLIDGMVTLTGDLQLRLAQGFDPVGDETYTILTAGDGLAGAFANLAPGERLDTVDGFGSFLVHYGPQSPLDPDQVILSDFDWAALFGDMNGDAVVDAVDVAPFVLALTDPTAYTAAYGIDPNPVGDINRDGVVDATDVSPFVRLLVGAAPQAVPEPASLPLLVLGGLMVMARRRRSRLG